MALAPFQVKPPNFLPNNFSAQLAQAKKKTYIPSPGSFLNSLGVTTLF